MLSRKWDTFDVAGIAQVIAGLEITNLRSTCAHVVQLISAAHSGSGLLRTRRKIPLPRKVGSQSPRRPVLWPAVRDDAPPRVRLRNS